MNVTSKNIDTAIGDRAIRLLQEHRLECPSLTGASAVVARQIGVGRESVHCCALQADMYGGLGNGATSFERVEIVSISLPIGVSERNRERCPIAPK